MLYKRNTLAYISGKELNGNQLNKFFVLLFILVIYLTPLPLFASSLCLFLYSSCSGHGQRQRQWGCCSPGGDNRKGCGACGCTWQQTAKVP